MSLRPLLALLFSRLALGCQRNHAETTSVLRYPPKTRQEAGGMCLTCHVEIEEMHAKRLLYCTECHGGDDAATEKDRAHVAPTMAMPLNPTIPPVDDLDLAYLQFLKPSNLRVVRRSCGGASPLSFRRSNRNKGGAGCPAILPYRGRIARNEVTVEGRRVLVDAREGAWPSTMEGGQLSFADASANASSLTSFVLACW
ncbi:MAG TPA: hypothetical protein QF764_13870 [Planctomycetota bacterium]|jgi:hypothetical protein|nr:hypothetical protein [Planctomycetota bacterium]HJP02851.1 hypothetical protein [Planctomycetota bacterium]